MEIRFKEDLEITSPDELIKTWNLVCDPLMTDTEVDMDFSMLKTISPFAATMVFLLRP